MNGGEARLSRRPFPIITGWGEVVVEEGAHGDADDVAGAREADGVDIPAGDGEAEAAKADAAAWGEGTGNRADGPEVTGASGTPPASDPAAAAAADSEEPPAGAYLKAGDGFFIRLPWESNSRAPVEGEALDGEVLASVGLAVVDAPSSSSAEPKEEQLLRKLVSLYRARQAKVERQEALVARAGADMEKRAAELREINQQAVQSLAEERRLLGEARTAFILEKAEAEEQQRLAAAELSVRESELVQKTASLASHEEEVAAREQALGGDLKKAQDAAAAAETAKKKLETRVAQLDSDLKAKGEELAALQQEREKGALTLGELQGRFAEKIQELDAAKNSNATLELKLETLDKALDSAKEREAALRKEVADNEELLRSAAVTQNTFRETVERWTEGLVDIAATIDKELTLLGIEDHESLTDENVPPSAKLTSFFEGVVAVLQHLRKTLPEQLAEETREAVSGALEKVLVKIVFRNPDIRLTNVLRPLPENADLTGIQALIAPIIKKAAGVRRIEGDRVD